VAVKARREARNKAWDENWARTRAAGDYRQARLDAYDKIVCLVHETGRSATPLMRLGTRVKAIVSETEGLRPPDEKGGAK
jgi:hypothetical protein